MKTKNTLCGLAVAVVLQMGLLAGSAQTNKYLFSGSKTNITLPPGTYIITAYGAQGGRGLNIGGFGDWEEAEFNFSMSTTLTLLVGGIIEREHNSERRDFYELLWLTGAAQSDGACLRAEDINWNTYTICFTRKKLKSRGSSIKPTLFRFSADIETILKRRPAEGQLFPYLCTVRAGDRATEFKQRCIGLGISGVSLHCYRYAWAERALKCGFPERFAQQALGHNSKAVHRAYAKHAEVTVPSLADWEKNWQDHPQRIVQAKLLPVDFRTPVSTVAQLGNSAI